jgi:hypothetical protein
MHKQATWVVVGFVAVVLIAAALNAVFFRHHALASTHAAIPEASDVTGTRSNPSDAPPCRSNQLELRINRGGPPKPPRHEDYVTLNHIRGGVCSFSRRQTRVWTFTPNGSGGARSLGGGAGQ